MNKTNSNDTSGELLRKDMIEVVKDARVEGCRSAVVWV